MAKFKFDKEDIRQHLQMQQDIINRMATNSSNCKNWLITIIAALTALQITRDEITSYGWLIPILCVMFWYLDSFYLGLEKVHRDKEKIFVEKVKKLKLDEEIEASEIPDIYNFSTVGEGEKTHNVSNAFRAMWNSSTTPFYVIMIVLSLLLSYSSCIIDIFKCNG